VSVLRDYVVADVPEGTLQAAFIPVADAHLPGDVVGELEPDALRLQQRVGVFLHPADDVDTERLECPAGDVGVDAVLGEEHHDAAKAGLRYPSVVDVPGDVVGYP